MVGLGDLRKMEVKSVILLQIVRWIFPFSPFGMLLSVQATIQSNN